MNAVAKREFWAITIGGSLLSLNAGFINVVTLAGVFSVTVSHALATSYSGAVVRTTHMTGICTDIANVLGHYCRKNSKAELWRLKVLVPISIGFLLGGIIGQAAFGGMRENALLLPAIFVGLIGGTYLSMPFMQFSDTNSIECDNDGGDGVKVRVKIENQVFSQKTSYAEYKNVDQDIESFLHDLDNGVKSDEKTINGSI